MTWTIRHVVGLISDKTLIAPNLDQISMYFTHCPPQSEKGTRQEFHWVIFVLKDKGRETMWCKYELRLRLTNHQVERQQQLHPHY
jgi:hypothetical protein